MKIVNAEMLELKKLDCDFSICKLDDLSAIDFTKKFLFLGITDEENSLVCVTENVPDHVLEREDGWKAFRIQGVLDFSLIGILSEISTLLADNHIGIFAISTYHTDYILTKAENYLRALDVLSNAGYQIT